MKYLADTHALIWYFAEDKRLGKKAKEIFLPTIVLAEAEAIAHKYGYQRKFHTLITKLKERQNFVIYPFDQVMLWKYFQSKPNLEIHDRVIVTTAKVTESIILTKDREIRKLKGVKTAW